MMSVPGRDKRPRVRSISDAVSKTLVTQASQMRHPGVQVIEEFREVLTKRGRCPRDDAIVVHVSGTKGKGSVSSYVEYLLRTRCGKLKVGLFQSPHIVDIRERFKINGEMVESPVFEREFWELYDECGYDVVGETYLPGFFHFTFLLATRILQDCDAWVVEVGLGGRLDATNALECGKKVCVVTRLDYDHTEILGNTLSAIAYEKFGTARSGDPVFTLSTQNDEVLQYLRTRSTDLKITYCKPIQGNFPPHDAENLGLAYGALQLLPTSAEELVEVLKRKPLGRETLIAVSNTKRVFVDGAHTPESLKVALSWYASREPRDVPSILVFYASHSRDLPTLLKAFKAHAFDRAVFTKPSFEKPSWVDVPKNAGVVLGSSDDSSPATPWTTTCAEVWRKTFSSSATSYDDVGDALASLPHSADVLVTGSLLLAGDAIGFYRR